MLLSGLRTLLVVLGLQGNGRDGEGERLERLGSQPHAATGGPRPAHSGHSGHHRRQEPSLGLKYADLVPAPRDLIECSKRCRIEGVS